MSNAASTSGKSFSRRDFLKITALAGASLGISAGALGHLLHLGRFHKVSETHHLMGTIVNFVVVAESAKQAQDAIQKTVAEMNRLVHLYDYRRAESPLGQLNSKGSVQNAPPELVFTLRQALHFAVLSHGVFDVTVKPVVDALRDEQPVSKMLKELVDYRLLTVSDQEISLARQGMSVTLDGIAKGSVVDGGVAILRQQGFANVLVEAGGDMMAKSDAAGEPWKIGIAHPRLTSQTIASLSIQNQAVATSGDYMNTFRADHSAYHIVDPRSGHSPAELASATVTAPSAAEADALSTTLMVLGVREGLALIEKLPGTAALLITKDLQIHRSGKFIATL